MSHSPRRTRSRGPLVVAAILLSGLLTAVAVTAPANAALWGGSGSNDVGPGTILFKVQNGRATIQSLQAVMSCRDTSDGTYSDRFFDVANGPTDTLNRNRFNFNFTRYSGGREGHVRLTGRFGSNGRGTARLNLTATGYDFPSNSFVERCQATVVYRLRRGGNP